MNVLMVQPSSSVVSSQTGAQASFSEVFLQLCLQQYPELVARAMYQANQALAVSEHNRFQADFLDEEYQQRFFEYCRDAFDWGGGVCSTDDVSLRSIEFEECGWNVVLSVAMQVDDTMFAPRYKDVFCLLNMRIGDDYPLILNYMKEHRRTAKEYRNVSYSSQYMLVYKYFDATSITEKELLKIFEASNFKIIKEEQYL